MDLQISESTDYHDYVIKNNKLICDFDNMYRNSSEIPWHQDKTAYYISDSQFLSLIQSMGNVGTVCEIGCGLGYFTNRIKCIGVNITGLDISSVAIDKAKFQFPYINFEVFDITKPIEKKTSGDSIRSS